MEFVVTGLSAKPYLHLYGLSDSKLAAHGVQRYLASEGSGLPDRIEMRDAKAGETLLLLNHISQPARTPYYASHAIFVLEGARHSYVGENIIPPVLFSRLLSLRGFDKDGMMVDAEVAKGGEIEPAIKRLFALGDVSYIHAHNATRGCYAGRIDRL